MRPIFLSFVLLPILITACSTPDKSARWENIGTISNGNIHTYINKDSVRKNGNLMIFQDKKVVTNLKQERFANTPHTRLPLPSGKSTATTKHTA